MISRLYSKFSPSLTQKIEQSIEIIASAYDKYGSSVGICFNGGKDSTVLLDLVHKHHNSAKYGFPMSSFFFKSPNEFPELASYVNCAGNFWSTDFKVIESDNLINGLQICVNKYNIKAILLGVRSSDPEGKDVKHFERTTVGWPNAMRVFPLLNWDYEDIWDYLDALKLPTCELYNKGYTSIGSLAKTRPNPLLYDHVNGKYKHARELNDGKFERMGRI